MSTAVSAGVEDIIAELQREAATNIALALRAPKYRRHDSRIYKERATVALDAAKLLEAEFALDA